MKVTKVVFITSFMFSISLLSTAFAAQTRESTKSQDNQINTAITTPKSGTVATPQKKDATNQNQYQIETNLEVVTSESKKTHPTGISNTGVVGPILDIKPTVEAKDPVDENNIPVLEEEQEENNEESAQNGTVPTSSFIANVTISGFSLETNTDERAAFAGIKMVFHGGDNLTIVGQLCSQDSSQSKMTCTMNFTAPTGLNKGLLELVPEGNVDARFTTIAASVTDSTGATILVTPAISDDLGITRTEEFSTPLILTLSTPEN